MVDGREREIKFDYEIFLKIMLKKDKLKNVKPIEIQNKVVAEELDESNIEAGKD